jgi:hypothetical protein
MKTRRASLVWVSLTATALISGCAEAEQGPHCRAYVECVRQADAERDTVTNVDRFLPDGACWDGTKGAAVCESSCRRGIPVLRGQEPAITCGVPQ